MLIWEVYLLAGDQGRAAQLWVVNTNYDKVSSASQLRLGFSSSDKNWCEMDLLQPSWGFFWAPAVNCSCNGPSPGAIIIFLSCSLLSFLFITILIILAKSWWLVSKSPQLWRRWRSADSASSSSAAESPNLQQNHCQFGGFDWWAEFWNSVASRIP